MDRARRSSPTYLLEDVQIREHILGKLSHAGLSDILIRKDKQRITVDIYTARPGIVIGKSGVEVDALRRELHAITKKNVHININEIKRPELDAKLVAQSIAEQLAEPGQLPPRDEALARLGDALGRAGHQDHRGGPARRRRDEPPRDVLRGPCAAAHDPRRHRLRLQAEAKTTFGQIGVKVWVNKGEIMPEGYEGTRRARRAPRRPGPGAAPTRRVVRGPRRLARGRAAASSDREGLGHRPAQAARRTAPGRPRARRRPRRAGDPTRRGQRRPWTPTTARRERRQSSAVGRAGGAAPRATPEPERPSDARGDPRGAETEATADADAAQDEVPPAPPRAPERDCRRARPTVQFGDYGLKALEAGWVTNRQIEAARIATTRKIRRSGKVWINLFPDKPFTKKPAETRMGSGKGSPEGWVAVVKPGRVMFELAGVARAAGEGGASPGRDRSCRVKTKFVKREADLFES